MTFYELIYEVAAFVKVLFEICALIAIALFSAAHLVYPFAAR